jgi:YidC/Oxa1 family membrane protein insertase
MWQTIVIQPFVNVLLLINSLINNFGVSIILFTLLIRLLTHPLTVQQFKATQGMQKLQSDPRYKKIQEKYKNDRERLSQEQMKLYKELGINPLGSCLPTLIQFPLILGLYQSVVRAMAASPFELFRLEQTIYSGFINPANVLPLQNSFLWMDLGQPESLTIFGIGIPVLAILVVITTYLQSKLIEPPSSGGNDQAAMMTKSMSIYMPVLMGFMAYSLASGLALYFLASNLIGIAQYAILGRANWSNVLPFLKNKQVDNPQDKKPAKVIDAVAEEVPEPDKYDSEELNSNKRMTMPRKQRYQRKKR